MVNETFYFRNLSLGRRPGWPSPESQSSVGPGSAEFPGDESGPTPHSASCHCRGSSLLSHADGLLSLPCSPFISSVSVHTLRCEDGANEHNPSVGSCDFPFPTNLGDQQNTRGEVLPGDSCETESK